MPSTNELRNHQKNQRQQQLLFKIKASWKLLSNAEIIDKHPHKRLQQVIELGICLVMPMLFFVGKFNQLIPTIYIFLYIRH